MKQRYKIFVEPIDAYFFGDYNVPMWFLRMLTEGSVTIDKDVKSGVLHTEAGDYEFKAGKDWIVKDGDKVFVCDDNTFSETYYSFWDDDDDDEYEIPADNGEGEEDDD